MSTSKVDTAGRQSADGLVVQATMTPVETEARAVSFTSKTASAQCHSQPSEAAPRKHHTDDASGRRRMRPFVYLVAIVAALGGLLFGYDIGGSGGTFVMQGFREHFGWEWPIPAEESAEVLAAQGWINALFTLGALVGAAPAGMISDAVGRRTTVMYAALLFCVAASVQTAAVNMTMMYVGRFFGGMAIGAESAIVPVYISECAPEHYRGQLSTMWQLAVTIGIVLAGALNIPLATWEEGWRISYGGNILFSLLLFVMMLVIMPESPRWLVAKGLKEQATEVLIKLRYEEEVAPELCEIENKVAEEAKEGAGSWLDLLRADNRMGYRTLLGVSLQVFQQLSGINAIMFFAPAMFSRFFSPTVALYGTLAINVVNHLATYITFATVDRFGRVVLMLASGVGMLTAHCVVAGLASIQPASQLVGILVITFSCGFVICFAFGWGPVVWTVCSEIYPLRLRGKAISVSTAANWGMATVVGKLFPIFSAPGALDLNGTFLLFAGFCALGTVCMYFFQPETANATLEEVDAIFAEHRPRAARAFWREAARNDAPLVDKMASRASTVTSRKLSNVL
eukprot:jgi/Tetstr1/437715/TSEL_026369.t1